VGRSHRSGGADRSTGQASVSPQKRVG
jgi:hypothetical protein